MTCLCWVEASNVQKIYKCSELLQKPSLQRWLSKHINYSEIGPKFSQMGYSRLGTLPTHESTGRYNLFITRIKPKAKPMRSWRLPARLQSPSLVIRRVHHRTRWIHGDQETLSPSKYAGGHQTTIIREQPLSSQSERRAKFIQDTWPKSSILQK